LHSKYYLNQALILVAIIVLTIIIVGIQYNIEEKHLFHNHPIDIYYNAKYLPIIGTNKLWSIFTPIVLISGI